MSQDFVKGRLNRPLADPAASRHHGTMHLMLRDNGLSIAFFGLFLIFLIGQAVSAVMPPFWRLPNA